VLLYLLCFEVIPLRAVSFLLSESNWELSIQEKAAH
jgi:hypothetical protein